MNDKKVENIEKIKKEIEDIIQKIQEKNFQNKDYLEKLLKISAKLKELNA